MAETWSLLDGWDLSRDAVWFVKEREDFCWPFVSDFL